MKETPALAHPQAIGVAPIQSEETKPPLAGPAFFALNHDLEGKSSYSFMRLPDQNGTLEGQLPPLREPRCRRYPAVSRAMYLDIPLKHEETSIIKRHPPRRIQKLEPIDLPQLITSERLLSQQEARTRHKAKQELEKKIQLPRHTPQKRQYLHKMQMLEMNHKRQQAQMELRMSLNSKSILDMQKLKDHNGNKITQNTLRSDGCDVLTIIPDETINRNPGSPQDEEFLEYHTENDYGVQKIGKVETWLREQEAREQLFWGSSSSDSDNLEEEERRPQALVRTKTERIPSYDEFYDRE
ncbi:uncharacterized protein CCDC198 isoform X2 [Meriones unguiculatus]|uniref:uncharacterized protein CCDC198 isoform X2 n=2 Tax=Meriones unguiculatus TaxID=10047 RepID=UPI000B4F7415|nr:uncharacterized protein CCDC198 isoform X2 [Meriones unguiculatus]XP_021518460.1 uncharacterized protein C14orf105 homolog isoform X2 [Meriones unguiculatus]